MAAILALFTPLAAQTYQCSSLEEATPAPADGRTYRVTEDLVLLPGTYRSTLYVCSDDITIDGNGASFADLTAVIVEGRRNVRIRGFRLRNASIALWKSTACELTGCTVQGGGFNVSFGTSHSRIAGNTLTGQTELIVTEGAHDNIVERNTFAIEGDGIGINVSAGAPANIVRDNTVRNGSLPDVILSTGIHLSGDSTIVIGNTVEGHRVGIWSTSSDNVIVGNHVVGPPRSVTYAAAAGIWIARDRTLVRGNDVRNSPAPGILVASVVGGAPREIAIVDNTMEGNDVGLREQTTLPDSLRVYHNNFIDNITQGEGGFTYVFWDNDSLCGGNYWTDHDTPAEGCVDVNADGICDSARTSSAGGPPFDRFPFAMRSGWSGRPGRNCPSSTDVDVAAIRIEPVQVIEGVPMVRDKATIVRVWVELTGRDRLDNVRVVIDGFLGHVEKIVTLFQRDGITYVGEGEDVERTAQLVERAVPGNFAWNALHGGGFTSVNFVGPYTPSDTGRFTITGTIDPENAVAEYSERNNVVARETKVVTYQKGRNGLGSPYPYVIEFRPARNILGSSHTLSTSALRLRAEEWANFLKAVYPVPEVRVLFTASTMTAASVNLFGLTQLPMSLFMGLGSFNHYFFSVDHTCYIMPDGAMQGLVGSAKGKTNGLYGSGSMIEETTGEHGLAHEVGHTLGLDHDYDDGDFPNGGIAADGWDPLLTTSNGAMPRGPKLSLNRPSGQGAFNYYSIMQRDPPQSPWICRQQYRDVMQELTINGADPELLIVRGVMVNDGRAFLLPGYTTTGVLLADTVTTANRLEVLDSGSRIIGSYPCDPHQVVDLGGVTGFIAGAIPWIPFARTLRLVIDDRIVDSLRQSPHAPRVTIDGVESIAGDSLRLRWNAIDDDGDNVVATVGFSHDEQTWRIVAADIEPGTAIIPIDGLPGGSNCRLRLIATDGVNTAQETSAPFTAPTRPPHVEIIAPVEGERVDPGRATLLLGFGDDPEHGPIADTLLAWRSDRDGAIGNGERLAVRLSDGMHRIVLEGRDDEGNVVADTVTINVASHVGDRHDGGKGSRAEKYLEVIPTPARDLATVFFSLQRAATIDVTVFDLRGSPVATPCRARSVLPGRHEVDVDVTSFPSGVYLVRVTSNDGRSIETISGRVVVARAW